VSLIASRRVGTRMRYRAVLARVCQSANVARDRQRPQVSSATHALLPPGATPPAVSRDRRRPQVSSATHALLCSAHGVCPPSRAAARPGGRCRYPTSRHPAHLAIVLPSARRRGWEDRQRATARWQEGMRGSRRNATPAAGCEVPRRVAGSSASAGLFSHPCPTAAVLAHGVCPPSRAAARPGGRCRYPTSRRPCHIAIVLPSARRRGWEDRQRATARWQEGIRGSRRNATPAAGCEVPRRVAGSSASAGLFSHPCPPAAVLAHGVCPPSRAAARPGGRCRYPTSRRPCHLAIVLPSARRRGWEDRQRATARWQEGIRGSGRDATPAAGCDVAGSAASAGLFSHPCAPAAVLTHGVCPPSRATARPGGRCRYPTSRRPCHLAIVLPSARRLPRADMGPPLETEPHPRDSAEALVAVLGAIG
jgi:hypothetical protein